MKNASRQRLVLGAAVGFLAATLYGCKDFLNRNSEPQGTLSETVLANAAGVEKSLIAAYRAVEWNNGVGGAWGNAASNWVWGSVPSDESYKGSEASDQPPINDIEGYHWSTGIASDYLNDKWRGAYEGVVRSNATLRLLKAVQTNNPGAILEPDAKSIEGEALFLRAHYHFEAYRMWGNVPYYKEDDQDFRKPNLQATEVIAEILKDLDAAIALLPTEKRNGEVGRVSKWVAKAYKGRVQVYAGNYSGAITTLNEVKTSGPFKLEESYDRVWTGFQQYANGPETILAYQASVNDLEPDGNNGNYGERLNFPHSGSHFGCCGFHQPSQNLVNFFQVDGAGLPLALTNPNWNASSANLTAAASAGLAVDPRLDWTVGRDGVPYKDWGLHDPGWIRSPAYGGTYSPKKNIHENASGSEQLGGGWAPTQQNGVNIHIFRYADMLLLLAEAEVEAGSLANARDIVNLIRARAAKTAQGCGLPTDAKAAAAEIAAYPGCAGDTRIAVPINDASIKWAVYRVGPYPSFPSKDYARTAVQYERRVELAMEGQRFFDLRRWGTFKEVLNAYVAVEKNRRLYLQNAEPVTDKHRWYPIPAIQIELSRVNGEAKLTQNTGW